MWCQNDWSNCLCALFFFFLRSSAPCSLLFVYSQSSQQTNQINSMRFNNLHGMRPIVMWFQSHSVRWFTRQWPNISRLLLHWRSLCNFQAITFFFSCHFARLVSPFGVIHHVSLLLQAYHVSCLSVGNRLLAHTLRQWTMYRWCVHMSPRENFKENFEHEREFREFCSNWNGVIYSGCRRGERRLLGIDVLNQ